MFLLINIIIYICCTSEIINNHIILKRICAIIKYLLIKMYWYYVDNIVIKQLSFSTKLIIIINN